MTRKRFKKLCMGLGFSRSMADNAAFTTWFCFRNYAEGWRMMEKYVAEVSRARLRQVGEEAPVCE